MAAFLPGEPPELLLLDEEEACPYLAGKRARMPMRLPVRALSPTEGDERLAAGDRRHGLLLYRPRCPTCRACEAIRLDVDRFTPSRTHQRVVRRGDGELEVEIGPPEVSPDRLALYERHRRGRGLSGPDRRPIDPKGYRDFLVESCVDTFELRMRHKGRLVGVSITDRGASSLSAVYCCYDPELAKLSLGTYAILKQVELCRRWGMKHLYLGLYVADNAHMRYKARFRPHERLIDGRWTEFR